jgi:ABC-2 type transporter
LLSAHTPREILAPLATPLLFALVIAPALAKLIPAAGPGGADYSTFVIVGTVGLLIPLTCTFAGIGVIVDRNDVTRLDRDDIAGDQLFSGVLTFTVFMYSVAEVMANRIPTQEEYVGLTPVVAILPWFLAGSLFPTALPGWLAWAARILPTTHALALLRYSVLDHTGAGLHNIWGFTSTTADAALSLLVLGAWAIVVTAAIHVFTRSAVT